MRPRSGPHGVRTASAAYPPAGRRAGTKSEPGLDMVVAGDAIPLHVVFWGLTWVESQAYIPTVGRVAERIRRAPARSWREGRIGAPRLWLEANRPSARSYRHEHSEPVTQAPDAPVAAAGRFNRTGAVGRPAADERSAGPRMRERRVDRPSNGPGRFGLPDRPRPRRQVATTTPPHHTTSPLHGPQATIPPDERTDR